MAGGADASALAGAVGSFVAPTRHRPAEGLGPGHASDLLVLSCGPAARRARNEPMVALMLRLARRAGEAASLPLGDIDWRLGMLSVRGRGNRLDRVPFPGRHRAPLARYLRSGRPPATAHRQVFLAYVLDHRPVVDPSGMYHDRAIRDPLIAGGCATAGPACCEA